MDRGRFKTDPATGRFLIERTDLVPLWIALFLPCIFFSFDSRFRSTGRQPRYTGMSERDVSQATRPTMLQESRLVKGKSSI